MQRYHHLLPHLRALVLCLIALSPPAAVPLAAQTHHFVYLSAATANAISGFELNPATGALTPIADSPFDDPSGPGALALHPSGRFLYVMNMAANNVSAFKVHPVTGALIESPASPFAVGAGGYTPQLFIVEPSGKFLYVVSSQDNLLGTVTSVSYYAIDQATGAINPAPDTTFSPGLFTPAGLTSRPGDKFLYLAGTTSPANGSAVSIFTIELDPDTGVFVDAALFGGQGQFARSVAISPDGRFLFVGRGLLQGSLDTYTITTPAAEMPEYSRTGSFPIPGAQGLPHALAVDASGSYLYGTVAGSGILGFSVSPGTGQLISLPGSPFVGPAVSPTSVMVADPVEPFIYFDARPFAISKAIATAGALEELAASPLPAGGTVSGIAAANPLDSDPVQPISAPLLTLAPLILQFSDQYAGTVSAPRPISLFNTGTAQLVLSGISLTGTHASEFALSTGDCLAVLPPGNGCTMEIVFQPMMDGARQAALTVVDNAIGSPHSVALTGAGRLPFTIQLDSFTSSVTAGQPAQYNLQLVPAPGFVGQVLLACSGAPAQAVCDAPPALQLNGVTPTPFTVRVPTTARSVLLPSARHRHPGSGSETIRSIPAWGALLTTSFLFLVRWRLATAVPGPQIRMQCAIVLLLVCAAFGLGSCAATTTGGSPSSTRGTPPGLYALTLTAAAGSSAQTVQLSLAVE